MVKVKKVAELSEEYLQRKFAAEADLEEFIKLVHPNRVLGNIHSEVIRWWTRSEAKKHQILLLPRDHGKSALLAYRIAWALTKDPTLRILLISSTSNLATKQLKFIKDIITCDTYRLFWPEMVNKDEAQREKWTEKEISVDHPLRKAENIRDPSIFTAGLTTNIVGMHCDIAALDDVVVADNAYTEDGRNKVLDQYGYLASIGGVNSCEWVVGTRYHPKDLYGTQIAMEQDIYSKQGIVVERRPLFEVFGDDNPRKIQVESLGDGSGEFLWPRQQRTDGKWFGFDAQSLSDKRTKYSNRLHFRAQYYNDPQDVDSSPISRNLFQYYEPAFLARRDGKWFFKGEPLNVVASVDFAYSLGLKADFSSIVVVGANPSNDYFVLDIERFKTQMISEYFDKILKLHEKWGFRQIRAEVSVAQVTIVKDLKENYIRKLGLGLSIDEYRPSRWQGSKDERIMAILQPKYANHQIYHYPGGNCQILEEELMFNNPAHDDVKDALASAIDFAKPPVNTFRKFQAVVTNTFNFNSRFGGTN